LHYQVITQADAGYGVMFKKCSPLRNQVNQAIKSLEQKGILQALKDEYIGGLS